MIIGVSDRITMSFEVKTVINELRKKRAIKSDLLELPRSDLDHFLIDGQVSFSCLQNWYSL